MAIVREGYQTFTDISTAGGSASLTIPANTNYVVVAFQGIYGSGVSITGIAINSVSLTSHVNGAGGYIYTLRSLVNPSTGSQTMTYTGDGAGGAIGGIVVYLSGVSAVRDTDYSNEINGRTTLTLTLDSTTTDYVIGFLASDLYATQPVPAPSGSGQTQFTGLITAGETYLYGLIEDSPGASTTTLSGECSWGGLMGISLSPAAGGSSALPRRALDGSFYGSLRGSVR